MLPIVATLAVMTPAAQATGPAPIQARLDSWRARNGPEWRSFAEPGSAHASFLYGGRVLSGAPPQDDAALEALARAVVEDASALTGVRERELALQGISFLPLGSLGSIDKLAVHFQQELDGVEIIGGTLSVLFDLRGNALAVQSNALPELRGVATRPALASPTAGWRALEAFQQSTGLPGRLVREPELGIGGLELAAGILPVLVWVVEVHWDEPGFVPEGWVAWIDALGGQLLRVEPAIHHAFDVGGRVLTSATPGTAPDIPSNPEVLVPLRNARVTSAAGVAFTDADGEFVYSGASGPLEVTVEYRGSFASVVNAQGPPHVLTQSIDGSGNVLLLNATPAGEVTAQANAYVQIDALREWIRSVNPTDHAADFAATANVNLNSNCNAFFNGTSVNFGREHLTCRNTAYSTFIVHEMGHWLNVRYGTGNNIDGMGEGNADVFALYMHDTALFGESYAGGQYARSAKTTRPFCGDCCPGCHSGAHDNGEVWMGTALKVRSELGLKHGKAHGNAIADALFLGWMNAFNQRRLRSVIEAQWLVLDDDDGNIENGTPNYAEIDRGFRIHGFPGVDLAAVLIRQVTRVPDTLDERGPYAVEASIEAQAAPSIASATLHFRTDRDSWSSVQMSETGAGIWRAEVPGQPWITRVSYYVEARDVLGNQASFPADAPLETLKFHVGKFVALFDDFEGLSQSGWTTGTFGDTSNLQDDWLRGSPLGWGGDPSEAYSGEKVWGNDLGPPDGEGLYGSNVHSYLRSPSFDASAATGARLRFARWLRVERSTADVASIAVNGQEVWRNPAEADLLDTSWTDFELDLSASIDGRDQVQLEFALQSNVHTQFGGWNIDDVEVYWLPACPTPSIYGESKPNSLGIEARIGWSGSPSRAAGDFAIALAGGIPHQLAVLLRGTGPDHAPFAGGYRLVTPPIVREETLALDLAGDCSVPMEIQEDMPGARRYYQFWYRDPGDPHQVGLSDALEVRFCE